MNKKILVLGLGNPVLGDDGIGIFLVRDLKKEICPHPLVHFEECSEYGLYLLDKIINYPVVILLDAFLSRSEPVGKVIFQPETASASSHLTSSPHYVSIPQILGLGKRYGLSMPGKLIIIGVVIHDGFHFSETLSPGLSNKYNFIFKNIKNYISRQFL